tara:strand:+ start:4457 stop:5917 length:1461 start_codon:yes stop_codon:yes gene_type:complete
MPAIITSKFRRNNAQAFQTSFGASGNVYYLGIGKPSAFGTKTRPDGRTENLGTDSTPITPADSVQQEYDTFDDLLAVKRINSSDVSFAAPRINWTSGTTYDYYRHDYGNRITGGTSIQSANSGATNLFDANFYVMNSNFQVYKCLDNNNDSPSTVEPTGENATLILQTSDDYKWKYMFTLSASAQANFLSTDFMGVSSNSNVTNGAVDGAVNIVKIKTAGTGGTAGTYTNIPMRGDGSGGEVSITITSGSVTAVSVTNKGSGYSYANIRVSDINTAGGGSLTGAELDCIIEPKGGHGFDPFEELGAFFVILNTSFEGAETANSGDFTTANDFRRVALIRDPKSSGSAATVTTLRATRAVRFSGTPGSFQVDEKITQTNTGAVGKVVQFDSANKILFYTQTRYSDEGVDANGNRILFSGTDVITGATSSATGTPTGVTETIGNVSLISGHSLPEIDEDSGDVMYIENRAPVARSADQTENVKLIIEF